VTGALTGPAAGFDAVLRPPLPLVALEVAGLRRLGVFFVRTCGNRGCCPKVLERASHFWKLVQMLVVLARHLVAVVQQPSIWGCGCMSGSRAGARVRCAPVELLVRSSTARITRTPFKR
jgi:hypothetical protein